MKATAASSRPWGWFGAVLGLEWERERRETLLLLLACALTVVPHLAHIPLWCSGGFALLLIWRLSLVVSGHPLPGGAMRTVAALACLSLIAAQYEGMAGREIGVALLVLFLGLKLMELRARRDTVVVICLCFFLLLTSFCEAQTVPHTLMVGLATLALIQALLTAHEGPGQVSMGRRLRLGLILLLQAIPIAAALFVVFPRLEGPLWGQPQTAGRGRTGLSETMSPGSITDLANHDEVAFRVDFLDPPPDPNTLYWRGPTLGDFNGQTWRPLGQTARRAPPEARVTPRGPALRYRTTLEAHPRRWLFALETPIVMPQGPGILARVAPDFEVLAEQTIDQRLRYDGVARLDALIGLNENAATLEAWRRLPAGRNPRTLALVQAWQSEGLRDTALIQRALQEFRTGGFRYTMQAPALGTHSVDDFLFRSRAGFCEHYASAMVVLMRAAGLPARVVTGYHGAEYNQEGDYWIVRQSDAHAWTEIWLPDRGWLRVDPTHAVAPSRSLREAVIREGRAAWRSTLAPLEQATWLKHWRLSLDALAHQWNQWVLNYDRSRQRALFDRVGLDPARPGSLAALIAAALTLGLGFVAVLTLRRSAPRDPVLRAYQHFCARLAATGTPRRLDETPSRYLRRIERLLDPDQAARAHQIVQLYERLRYDPSSRTAPRLSELRRQVRAFRP